MWFRRARLLIVSPDSRANLARRQAETPLIVLCRFPEPALSDSKELLCEAVSAKSNPELANILTSDRETVLYGFGFEPVGVSRNYSQRIDIESDEDLGYAARAFRILKQIYQVKSFGSGTFKLHIPNVASN